VDGPREAVLAGAGLEAAADRVLATIDAIVAEAGAPAAVRLLGFSQGGALAVVLAAREPDRFDRVVVLSGFVPAAWADKPGPERLPPVLWGRGDADEVIPAAAVARTAAWLGAHADATVRRYPGLGHGVGAAELEDVAAFLR
jgi:phospholipase/carboxylesterase